MYLYLVASGLCSGAEVVETVVVVAIRAAAVSTVAKLAVVEMVVDSEVAMAAEMAAVDLAAEAKEPDRGDTAVDLAEEALAPRWEARVVGLEMGAELVG